MMGAGGTLPGSTGLRGAVVENPFFTKFRFFVSTSDENVSFPNTIPSTMRRKCHFFVEIHYFL